MLTAPYTSWSRLYVLTIQEDTFSLTWNWVIVQHAIYKSVSRHLSEQLWYLAGVCTVGLASGAWGWINNLWYTPELHAQDCMQLWPRVQGPMPSLVSGTKYRLQLHLSAIAHCERNMACHSCHASLTTLEGSRLLDPVKAELSSGCFRNCLCNPLGHAESGCCYKLNLHVHFNL